MISIGELWALILQGGKGGSRGGVCDAMTAPDCLGDRDALSAAWCCARAADLTVLRAISCREPWDWAPPSLSGCIVTSVGMPGDVWHPCSCQQHLGEGCSSCLAPFCFPALTAGLR